MGLVSRELPNYGFGAWRVKTAPAKEPITLDEFKQFTRIDSTDEDEILNLFITAAREATEFYTGRTLITQTLVYAMDYWPNDEYVVIPQPPLISIVAVRTLDESGASTTYSSDNYYTDITRTPGRLVIKSTASAPLNDTRSNGGYEIEYTAGYGSTVASIPAQIRAGVMLWAAYLYENRILVADQPPPDARKALYPYRILNV